MTPTIQDFLPMDAPTMKERGWDECDFVLVSGDAYVDHPSFGPAVISRLLEADGFRVCILAQPDWSSKAAFATFGRPRLGFLVTAGNMDSMVNRYTANRRTRSEDAYSPGGKAGLRPDRAVISYCNRVREAFKGIPILIGGIEASLRRFSQYDYWSDTVKRSVLLDSKADLLVYGMGETQIREIARRLASGEAVGSITDVRGTAFRTSKPETAGIGDGGTILLPSFESVSTDKRAFAESFMIQYRNSDPFSGKRLVEPDGARFVVQNPPAFPLEGKELDRVYELPYARSWHPSYDAAGGIPALSEIEFSLVSSRGCFGGCSFCAICFHEGRIVTPRGKDSILREAALLTRQSRFKGYIHDVGGPTANFRNPACAKQAKSGACVDRQCLFPEPCPNLEVSHRDYLELLREVRAIPGVKKVFVRSGIRYDYLMLDPDESFLRELCEHHVSGQLKVAPEHVSARVLQAMGKPGPASYERFAERFAKTNEAIGKKQYLIPYFIASHPGSELKDAIELAENLRDSGFVPDQVQDFYPTPGTLSTCMYYTGLDPRTMEPIRVPSGGRDRSMQRALLQYSKPENHDEVREALYQAGREDLIGSGSKALVPPERKGEASGSGRFRGKEGR
jgi:uncharacterized radical SAM protein YgiQ